MIASLLLLFIPAQEQGILPVLNVGDDVRGEVHMSDPPPESAILFSSGYSASKKWRIRYKLKIDQSGPYYLQLRSQSFDSYLILRNSSGKLIQEDDDGWYGNHSRIICSELDAESVYFVDVVAMRYVGSYRVQLLPGAPKAMSRKDISLLEFDEAIKDVSWAEERHGLNSLPLANNLEHLGGLYLKRNQFAEALPLFERAYSIRQNFDDELEIARIKCAYNLARCYSSVGELHKAQGLFKIALKGWREKLGAADLSTAICMGMLANVTRRLGFYQEAWDLFEKALPILDVKLEDRKDYASHLVNHGLLLSDLGRNAEARIQFEKSLAIDERTLDPNHLDLASTRNNLAILFHRQGLYSKARELYQLALKSRLQHGDRGKHLVAEAHINLAILDIDEGQLEDAKSHFEAALAINEQVYGRDHLITSCAVFGMGRLMMQEQRVEEAIEYFQRALSSRQKAFGLQHTRTLICMRELSGAYRRLGEFEKAHALLSEVIEINTRSESQARLATASMHAEMAFLLADQGKVREAWDEMKFSMSVRRESLTSGLAALSEGERFQALAALEWSEHFLVNLAGQIQDPEVHAATLAEVLGWKGLSSRLLISSRKELLASLSEEDTQNLKELRGLQATISNRLFFPPSGSPVQEMAELDWLEKRRNQIELTLQRNAGFQKPTPLVEVSDLQALLPNHSAFLCLFVHDSYQFMAATERAKGKPSNWGGSVISAWLLSPNGLQTVELGPAEPIENAIRELKEYLVAFRGGKVVDGGKRADPNKTVRDLIWQPLAQHLQNTDLIFVSPSAFLGGVPFEVLEMEDKTFLLESYRFVYSQDIPNLLQKISVPLVDKTNAKSLLVIGDVDYNTSIESNPTEENLAAAPRNHSFQLDGPLALDRGSSFGTWYPIPGTQYESNSIHYLHKRHFDKEINRDLLVKAQASEQQIKARIPGKHFLHFATHGFFQPEGLPSMWEVAQSQDELQVALGRARGQLVGTHPGYLAGLVCAGANEGSASQSEDGFLTAEEVAWLDLESADLVVLSACQTGLGQTRGAEGMISLSRAFHLAGAQTVISSMWSIKDYPASDLMLAFYRNLWKEKMGKLQALRAAQLEMLQSNKRLHGDGLPSTWGAFVLSGDWR